MSREILEAVRQGGRRVSKALHDVGDVTRTKVWFETEDAATDRTLEVMGYVPRGVGADYSAQDEEAIKRRLKDLGYI
jgi:hypothetical protein